MNFPLPSTIRHRFGNRQASRRTAPVFKPSRLRNLIAAFVIAAVFPAIAAAQSGSPFDTGFTNLQNLFTGTIAKVASLIAIVVGGYEFAHGEPGAKKVAAGTAGGSVGRLLAGKLRRRQQAEAHPATRPTPARVD